MSKQARIPEGYELVDGKARLEPVETCARGHEVKQVGMGPRPGCKRLTMRWYCSDLKCDGTQVSTAHRKACQKRS